MLSRTAVAEEFGGRVGRIVIRWLPVVVWMAAIFEFSSVPGSRLPGRFGTLAHFLTYAILGGLLALALKRGRPSGRAIALAVMVASLYAVTDEFHQAFVPLRTPDVADWGVDTLGSLVGAWTALWLAQRVGRWRGRGESVRAQ